MREAITFIRTPFPPELTVRWELGAGRTDQPHPFRLVAPPLFLLVGKNGRERDQVAQWRRMAGSNRHVASTPLSAFGERISDRERMHSRKMEKESFVFSFFFFFIPFPPSLFFFFFISLSH